MKAPRIILPSGAAPKFKCELCPEVFWESAQLARHAPRCARKHHEEILELQRMNRERDPLEQATDFEALEFQRRRYAR